MGIEKSKNERIGLNMEPGIGSLGEDHWGRTRAVSHPPVLIIVCQ